MNRILALDLSLTNAGVCRLSDEIVGQPWYEVETVCVPPKRVPGARPGRSRNEQRTGAERLLWWKAWLVEEINPWRDGVTVAVEQLAFGAPRLAEIAKLYGVLEVTCAERDVGVVYVGIQAIKRHATGMHDCDKRRMIDTARARFGEHVLTEHEADAAWLCDYVYRGMGE